MEYNIDDALKKLSEVENLIERAYWKLKDVEVDANSAAYDLWYCAKSKISDADTDITDLIIALEQQQKGAE